MGIMTCRTGGRNIGGMRFAARIRGAADQMGVMTVRACGRIVVPLLEQQLPMATGTELGQLIRGQSELTHLIRIGVTFRA